MEVFAAGHLGDRLQRLFVEPHIERIVFRLDRRTLQRPKADGKHAHATLGRHLRDFERIRPGRAAAVAQQNDDARGVGTQCDRLSRFFRLGLARTIDRRRATTLAARPRLTGNHRFDVDSIVGKKHRERQDEPAAGRGGALQLEAIDRCQHVGLAVCRRLHHGSGAGE